MRGDFIKHKPLISEEFKIILYMYICIVEQTPAVTFFKRSAADVQIKNKKLVPSLFYGRPIVLE